MKTIYTAFLVILGLFLGNLLAFAQPTTERPILPFEDGSAEESAAGDVPTVPIEIVSMDLVGESAVGGGGEDIGAPNESDSTDAAGNVIPPEPESTASFMEIKGIDGESTDDSAGTELDDIGARNSNTSPGIEPDEIDAPSADSEAFGVEREMKESGEKGGTEDINIGIGEMQEATDAEHKDWINILSVSQGVQAEMNKADLIDEIANNSDGGLRSGYLKIGDIKGESLEDDGLEPDEIDAPSANSSAKKPKEIVVVGSKVRSQDVLRVINFAQDGEENAAPDSFFDIWIDAGEDRNTVPDSFFDIIIDVGEERGNVPDSFFDIFVDVTDEDLQLQAVSVAQNNDDIEEVEITEKEVTVEVTETIKLFGFIPVQTTAIISSKDIFEVDERVSVELPWWSFLGTPENDPEELEEAIKSELELTIPVVDVDDRPTEEVAFYYNKIQAQTLQTISNVSK